MYDLKAILDKEPVTIASALRSLLFVGVLAGFFVMDEHLLAGIALGAEVLLGLFVRNSVTPNSSAKADAVQAYAEGVTAGSGTEPVPVVLTNVGPEGEGNG